MGNKTHRSSNDHSVMKQVWSGIDKNPQYHANLFFISFCKTHAQYSKYFTTDVNAPLSVDARTSAKFRLIIEALGYLLLDSYKKPDQLDYITGYIAMVHKDMELNRSDMFNFGESLIDYLTVTFPRSMTPDCRAIVSGHIHNLLNEISRKMEDLRESDVIGTDVGRKNEKVTSQLGIYEEFFSNKKFRSRSIRPQKSTKGRLRRRSASIYGHTVDYWIERKREWDERLESWRRQTDAMSKETGGSSPEEEPRVTIGPVTVASVGSHADQFLKSYGVIGEVRQASHDSRRRRPTLMTKRSGEMQYKVVETMIDALNKSNRERNSITTDSIARQRRRQRHSDSS
ncbi:uncharacterized protein LOC107038182 [Diachasma alloeum]|uniref:uncharacterized protein LOC107038182 n=1 Tax=Diachasma alloeum TaxID=454923 RepID=UPI00073831D5|nr:uncharacterized protein LOC107038182 [Diachasma alloeum]